MSEPAKRFLLVVTFWTGLTATLGAANRIFDSEIYQPELNLDSHDHTSGNVLPKQSLRSRLNYHDLVFYSQILKFVLETPGRLASHSELEAEWNKKVKPTLTEKANASIALRRFLNLQERLRKNIDDHPDDLAAVNLLDTKIKKQRETIAAIEKRYQEDITKRRDANHSILETLIRDEAMRGQLLGLSAKELIVDSVFYRNDTQLAGALVIDPLENTILILFIGSQSGWDWFKNVIGMEMGKVGELNCHVGIHSMWEASFDSMRYRLAQVIAKYPTARILNMGHSMGGSLAIMNSYHLKANSRKGFSVQKHQIDTITFATPPVFDYASAAHVEEVLKKENVLRFILSGDFVPSLSLMRFVSALPRYRHVGIEIDLPSGIEELSITESHRMATYVRAVRHADFERSFARLMAN